MLKNNRVLSNSRILESKGLKVFCKFMGLNFPQFSPPTGPIALGQDELNELRAWLAAPEGEGAKDEYRRIAELRDFDDLSEESFPSGNGGFERSKIRASTQKSWYLFAFNHQGSNKMVKMNRLQHPFFWWALCICHFHPLLEEVLCP